MKKIVEFNAGFDKRDVNPAKNFGIHGLEIRFVLKNYKGAVQFLLFTNWLPANVSPDLKWFEGILPTEVKDPIGPMFVTLLINPFMPAFLLKPMPADLGYHSPKPLYDDQGQMTDKCKFLNGKPCYYDGSGLNAMKIFNILLNEGEEGVWKELLIYHESIFGESILKRLRKKIDTVIIAYLKFTGADKSIRDIKEFLDSRKKNKEETG